MLVSPAIPMLLAAIALLGCVQAASAQTGQPRQPAASRSISSNGQTAVPGSRNKPPLPQASTQDEKNWMDRASAPSGSGPSGM